VLAVTSVLLTNSRGGMIGLILAFFLSSVTGKSLRRAIQGLLFAGILLVPVVLFVVPETQKTRFESLWDDSINSSAQGSLEVRKLAAEDGWRIFTEHPITGVGLENFKRYRRLRGDASDLEAHNIYIQALGEMGILGGAAFILVVYHTWRGFQSIKRLADDSPSVESEFLRKLALAGRNSLLLLIYFGLLGSNLDRFNWFWLAGISVAGVAMARQAAADADEIEWRRASGPMYE
jgi:O-antigen ligase